MDLHASQMWLQRTRQMPRKMDLLRHESKMRPNFNYPIVFHKQTKKRWTVKYWHLKISPNFAQANSNITNYALQLQMLNCAKSGPVTMQSDCSIETRVTLE